MRPFLSVTTTVLLAFTVASFATADDKNKPGQQKPGQQSGKQRADKNQLVVGKITKVLTKQNKIVVEPQAGGQQIQTQSTAKEKGPRKYLLQVDGKTKIANRTNSKTKPGQQGKSPLTQLAVGQTVKVVFVRVRLDSNQNADQGPGKVKPGQSDQSNSKTKPGQQQQNQKVKPGQNDNAKPNPNAKVKPGQQSSGQQSSGQQSSGQQSSGQQSSSQQSSSQQGKGTGQQQKPGQGKKKNKLVAVSIDILTTANQSQKDR